MKSSVLMLIVLVVVGWFTMSYINQRLDDISDFDLFGIHVMYHSGHKKENRIKRNIQKYLISKLPKDFIKKNHLTPDFGLFCAQEDNHNYRVHWECGHFRGCSVEISEISLEKKCPHDKLARFMWPELINVCEKKNYDFVCQHVKGFRQFLNHHSQNYPEFKIGKTTTAEIEEMFGKPAYSNAHRLVYVKNRNRKMEAKCKQYINPKEGIYYGQTLVFYIKDNVLRGTAIDSPWGDC